jgi:hypothetical protein
MVSRLVYAFGDRVDEDALIDTLTRLWVNALRLPMPPVEVHRERTRGTDLSFTRRRSSPRSWPLGATRRFRVATPRPGQRRAGTGG